MISIRTFILGVVITITLANQFRFGSSMIPHPDKVDKGGQDAFIASSNLLIVADGVGGWSEIGIDAGLFSKELLSNAYAIWRANAEFYSTRPQQLMIDSVKKNTKQGSSTMSIVTMDKNGRVHSANLGDSGYKWLRRNLNGQFQILYQSKQQQHQFNFPYQLASPTSKQAKGDDPSLSDVKYHDPQHNDYFIVGSDGIFDNLYMKEILDILTKQGKFDKNGQMTNKDVVAKFIAQRAISYGKNQSYISPFAAHAKKQGQQYLGGKLDDSTIIIAQVSLTNQNIKRQVNIPEFKDNRIPTYFDKLSSENINRRMANNLAAAFKRTSLLY